MAMRKPPRYTSSVKLVRDAWARLEAWCHRNFPDLLSTLNPGASVADLTGLERTIQHSLPAEVRESLALHNGQPWQCQAGFVFGLELLDAGRIAERWELWAGLTNYNEEYRADMVSTPDGAIQLDYANPGWIPLTLDAGGNHLGVDLAPGPDGTVGQVINFGRDERRKSVLAASWGEFLLSYAKFLESDDFELLHAEVDSWDTSFEPVFESVADDGRYYIRRPHEVVVEWQKQGRWPLR